MRDHVKLIRGAEFVAGSVIENMRMCGEPGLSDLGITPTALEAVVPSYVGRYRRGGQWAYR